MQKIFISNYNPLWAKLFEKEKKKLFAVLPSEVIIEHIGSTSIIGLASKPVIDILNWCSLVRNYRCFMC